MTPLLSIIVPHYNHASALPALLDSICAQTLKELEVIVVDDCSDAPPDAVVEAYRNKGLTIRQIRSAQRSYTKNARLAGIREAQAPIIATVDADDVLWGTEALELHVQRMREEQAEILHFRTVFTTEQHEFAANFSWADPHLDCLEGPQIFDAYARSGLRGFALWNKLYTKNLWMKFLKTAWDSTINIYTEDIYLSSMCMFHAEKYISSEHVGYGWAHSDKRAQDSMLRTWHSYIMLQELVPYFRERTQWKESVEIFSWHMRAYFRRCAGRWSLAAHHFHERPLPLSEELSAIVQLKMLILATGINAATLNMTTSHVQ